MSDLLILVENIRTSIAFPETVPPDQMRVYARHYAEACTLLNRRLLECVRHIRSGNLTDGIRLAELKPNLSEMYQLLDFTQREEWCEIVSTLGFNSPPPLSPEMFQELDEAYMKQAPLEPLLRRHRLHALNGSSIRDRLSVLRAIAKTDRENLFWMEDQEKFEKVRLKELDKEIQKSLETKNALQVRLLHQELSSPDWIIPPPVHFRQRLVGSVVQDYANTLMAKFSVFEFEEALNVYNSIQRVLSSERMSMPSDTGQLIRPAVQWLNETQRQNALQMEFQRAVAELQNALEEDTPLPNLERLYYDLSTAATQAETVIPSELDELYHSEVNRRHVSTSRRNLLIVAAFVVGCLLVGGLVVVGVIQSLHADKVAETIASLQRLKTDNRVEEMPAAIERTEKEPPQIANHPQVAAALEELRQILIEDDKRAKDFQRYHSEADAQLNTPESSELIGLNRIRNSIDQAEKLVRTPTEKTALTDIQRRHALAVKNVKQEIDKKYSDALADISNEFNVLRRNTDAVPSEAIFLLKEQAQRLQALQRSTDVEETLKSEGNSLANSIAEHQKKMERLHDQNNALLALFSKVPNWTDYQSALKKFATDFSDHYAVVDIKEVLGEWDTVKDAATQIKELADAFSKNNGNFTELLRSSDSLLKQYKEVGTKVAGPLQEVFPPGDLLDNLSKTIPYTPGTLKSTETRLKELIQRDVYPWIDSDQKWYYLTKEPIKAGTYNYITAFVADERSYPIKNEAFSPDKIPIVTQRKFAEAALKKIDKIDGDADIVVGTIMRDVRERQNNTEPGIDPILQCILMDLLIKDMSKIDPFFATNFARVKKTIEDSDIDQFSTWMDVQSRNTLPQRNKARTAIARLPEIEPLIKKSREERTKFRETITQLRPHFEWVAAVTKKDGKWDCAMKPGFAAATPGELFIFRQNVDKTARPIKIGRIVDGKVEVFDNVQSLLQGAPVFFVQK